MRLVVGLQNPGSSYEGTRHNVGAEVVAAFASANGAALKKARRFIKADVAELHLAGHRCAAAVTRTFMNESGSAVQPLARYYGVAPGDLLVVHDDIDLPFAKLRVALGSGSGGNNGIRSTIRSLGTPDFWRLKFGVGRPPGRMDPADFVLRRFSTIERPKVEDAIIRAVRVVERFVEEGGDAARQLAGESNVE